MGLMRKALAVSSGGLISYRNTQERTAHFTKQTRNATRMLVAQNGVGLEVSRQQAHHIEQIAVHQAITPNMAPANWYPDPGVPGWQRWFDPQVGWTGFVRPMGQG